MAATATIKLAVGYKAPNRPDDVRVIHDLLSQIPSDKGGPPVYFNPSAGYNPMVTDIHILSFQNRWFRGSACDAVVSPNGATIKKMREVAVPGSGNHSFVTPTKVIAVMTGEQQGTAIVKGFSREKGPDGKKHYVLGRFRVPLYLLKVGVGTTDGKTYNIGAEKAFPVIRYGVRYDSIAARAGRPNREWFSAEGPPLGRHTLKRVAYSGGSWQLRGDYLIHVGPDTKAGQLFGGLGCIQPVDGGMGKLDEFVRELSFSDHYRMGFIDAKEADRQITLAGSFACLVETPRHRPRIQLLDDLSNVGGPRAGYIQMS